MMKAVILAAGPGTRMRPLTKNQPKGLLILEEESIVERQIRILRESGIDDIAVVVGHESQKFEDEIDSDIKIIENEDYLSTDNLYSFNLAKDYLYNEDFLVLNGDAIFSKKLIKEILKTPNSAYAIDRSEDEESIKVQIEDDKLVRILGKNVEDYDGVTTEVFKISQEDSKELFEAADEISTEDQTQWFDSAVDEILDECHFDAVDVTGIFWTEVDEPNELEEVRRKMNNRHKD